MPRPLPTYVRDESGRVHYRGSPEYDATLLEREGEQVSRLEEMLDRFEALVERSEAAAAAIKDAAPDDPVAG